MTKKYLIGMEVDGRTGTYLIFREVETESFNMARIDAEETIRDLKHIDPFSGIKEDIYLKNIWEVEDETN